ncbi:MAG TPA: hypothetical protein VJ953_04830 [Saprospiraceae bacterium]|nr:hypothetical protein [Saprospiraceae bacterium]
MKQLLAVMLLAVLLVACNQSDNTGTELEQDYFFNLEDYFESEIERLDQTEAPVTKVLSINGLSEEVPTDTLNFSKELSIFKKSDINRTAWIDKYKGDTTRTASGDIQRIIYSAIRKDLRTRKIVIDFEGGEPSKIAIRNETDSPALTARQMLIYQPDNGFSISQEQKVRALEKKFLKIEVKYQ